MSPVLAQVKGLQSNVPEIHWISPFLTNHPDKVRTCNKSVTSPLTIDRGGIMNFYISFTFFFTFSHALMAIWQVLERPVKVDLAQSAVSGAEECKFAIHL